MRKEPRNPSLTGLMFCLPKFELFFAIISLIFPTVSNWHYYSSDGKYEIEGPMEILKVTGEKVLVIF